MEWHMSVRRPYVRPARPGRHRADRRHSIRVRVAQLAAGSLGLSMLVVAGPAPALGLSTQGAAASVTASGVAKAGPEPTAKDGEVVSLRTATSRTYRLPSGVYQARVFGHAVNYRDARGAWQKVDDALAPAAGGWRSGGNPNANVQIPSALAGHAVGVTSAAGSAGFVLVGASAVPASVRGATARFHNALAGVDVVEQATDVGLKESLILASSTAPSMFVFTPQLSAGLSLRPASDGGLSVTDAGGHGVWRVPAATLSDAAGATSSAARFAIAADGSAVTLSVDRAWLSDPSRAFPVTVDPSVVGVSPSAETYIYSGAPTTNYSAQTTEKLGHDVGGEYRLLVKYDVASALPKHVDILQSALQTESLSASAGAISVQTFQSAQAWTTSATWNTYDGTHSWTAAGGDVTGSAIDTQTVPNNSLDGDGDDAQWFGLQPLASSWYGGGTNNGLEVKQSGTTASVVSWPQGGSMWLNVDYVYRTGLRGYFNYYKRSLNDRAAFNVNTANGNMVLQEKDLQVSGVGVPLQLVRTYNSQGDANPTAGGGFPIKWSQGYGRDVKTDDGWNDGELYYGASGDAYWLEGNPPGSGAYTLPSGFNAFFTRESDGTHTVQFHKSGIKMHFGSFGLNDTVKDKNTNTITLTYQTPLSSSSQLTSVTDTQGRSYSLSYTSGHITSMTDANLSTSRTWGYGYDGTNTYLTSYTDPTSHTSSYGYSGVGSTSCTAPTGILCTYTDARGNTTTFNYDTSNRVTSIQDPGGNCAGTPATGCVTFSYSDPSGSINSSCPTGTDPNIVGSTTETDENGHTTIYCWDKSDKVLHTIDGNSHRRDSTYTSNNDVATLNGSTTSNVFTLAHDSVFNLTSVQRPGGTCSSTFSSSTGCPAQLTYPGSTGTLSDYRASSASDGQHNCTSYSYDTTGNMTDTYSGQSSGTSGCAGGTGGTHQSNAYQGDTGVPNCGPSGAAAKSGELCSTTDGAGHKTSFTYDSNGNLTTVAPPAPLGSTSVSVDGDGRSTSITDGASRTTKYFYDGNDRITELRFDGGTSTTCTSTDATAGNCISYSYDNNGNLTSRLDNTGTTSYTYDAFNRPLTKSFPSSISTVASTVTYDAVGNVATYVDAGTGTGSITYGYDAANNLTKVAEPGGSCPSTPTFPNSTKCVGISYTNDNQRTKVNYPSGETLLLCYDASNRETLVDSFRPSASVGTCTTPGSSPFLKRSYSYVSGSTDVDLRTEVTDQAGTNTFYGYDTSNRVCWAGTATFSSCGSSTSRTFGYNYDSAGNITSAINGASTTFFGYNNADELCWSGSTNGSISSGSSACTSNAGPVGDTDYLYDGAGNTCWTASTTSTLNTCSSAPTGATTYSYNSKGQNTAIGSTSFSYADIGQKELVTIGSATLINGLEGVNRRSDSVNVTRDAGGNLLELRNGDGTTSANSAYTLDALGSTIGLTDSAGTTDTALYTYQPYGATASSSGTLATTNPFRYASGYQLTTPSMYHYGDRYYNQAISRWTQRDAIAGSIASPRDVDRYTYTSGDPVNLTDPSGKCDFVQCFSTIGEDTETGATVGGTTGLVAGCLVGGLATGGVGCIPGAGIGATAGALAGTAFGFGYGIGEDIVSFF
jgi:RHS repeat-associated protein